MRILQTLIKKKRGRFACRYTFEDDTGRIQRIEEVRDTPGEAHEAVLLLLENTFGAASIGR